MTTAEKIYRDYVLLKRRPRGDGIGAFAHVAARHRIPVSYVKFIVVTERARAQGQEVQPVELSDPGE